MKNILKTSLAVAMSLVLCTVSFASGESKELNIREGQGFFTYDNDEKSFDSVSTSFELGKDLYIKVDTDIVDKTPTLSDLGNFRVKKDFELGKNIIKSVSFVRLKDGNTPILAIKVEVNDTYTSDEVDVDGNIIVTGRNNSSVNIWNTNIDSENPIRSGKEVKIPLVGTFSYVGNDSMQDFENEDEANIDVEWNSDIITIEADVRAQKDLYIKANSDVVNSLLSKYTNADLSFINFEGNNKTFYKNCTMHIPYEYNGKTPFIYERTDSGLKLIDGVYDTKNEEFVIKTKVLGNYVISDRKLVLDTENKEEISKVEPVVPENKPNTPYNPNTGAVESTKNNLPYYVITIAFIISVVGNCYCIYINRKNKRM